MKNFIVTLLLILSAQTLWSQQVSNVNFKTSGKQIVVTYNLTDEASSGYSISLYYNINDGPWQGPLKSVTGNVGPGQRAGNQMEITWNVLNDLDKLAGEISFKVQAEVYSVKGSGGASGTFTDSRDGRSYKTVKIGTQTWMAENLAWLPSVSPSKNGSEKEIFYYVYGYEGASVSSAKATANYVTHGVLYNWPAALTACPSGWHLPDDAEWTILTDFLTNNGYGYGGKRRNIGKSMASTECWTSYSKAGTIGNDQRSNNRSGFLALPGGDRNNSGNFYGLGDIAYFWSSSEFDASGAWYRYLYYNDDGVYRYGNYKRFGFSTRCLQNK